MMFWITKLSYLPKMVRSHDPFTKRQLLFLEALRNKICDITDPEPEILTHEDYAWHYEQTKEFGRIPKIRFKPYSTRIKAEIMKNASLVSKDKEIALEKMRKKYGINSDKYSRARNFESEWNSLMVKALRAMKVLARLNSMFAAKGQSVSDLVKMLQEIVLAESFTSKNHSKKQIFQTTISETAEKPKFKRERPYNEVLEGLE